MANAISTQTHSSDVVVPVNKRPLLNPAELYLLRMTTFQSREKVVQIANSIAKIFGADNYKNCDWGKIRREHLMLIRASYEKKNRSPATINLILAVMKGIAEEAWNLNLISDHDFALIKNMKSAKGSRQTRGRALAQEEIHQLFELCDAKPGLRNTRDAAILALGIGCGLRRAEIVGLRIDRIVESEQSFTVIGKGNKERSVYCSRAVWSRLSKWLTLRGQDGIPEVFCRIVHGSWKTEAKSGRIDYSKPISTSNVYMILKDFQRKLADVLPFAPHDMRRTFATRLFEMGADIDTVKKAMGHSSIVTTQRYDKRGDEEMKRMARMVQL